MLGRADLGLIHPYIQKYAIKRGPETGAVAEGGGCSAARRAATVFWFVMYNSYGFRLPGNTCVSVSARYTHTFRRRQTRGGRGEGGGRGVGEGNASDGAQQPPDENAMLFPILFFVAASSSVGQTVRLCMWAW